MKTFDKYQKRGSMHWNEMDTKDIRKFNAYHQARYELILKYAELGSEKKVLDVGCGDGALTYLLAKTGAMVSGVDNDALGIDFAKAQIAKRDPKKELHYEVVLSQAETIPFPDASFDVVTLCEVIEHLEDPSIVLKEIRRVLKNGGCLVLTTPHRLTEVSSDHNHVHEFYPEELRSLLRMYFSDVSIYLTHHVFWYGLYSYAFRAFRNRQFGKWFINALALWFGYNPFMIEYPKPTKRDVFTSIAAVCK
jgi:2-polyprenyl-3-methyl-5-hydroxy-6-metoxy-1,4-benzoquinol methylase